MQADVELATWARYQELGIFHMTWGFQEIEYMRSWNYTQSDTQMKTESRVFTNYQA